MTTLLEKINEINKIKNCFIEQVLSFFNGITLNSNEEYRGKKKILGIMYMEVKVLLEYEDSSGNKQRTTKYLKIADNTNTCKEVEKTECIIQDYQKIIEILQKNCSDYVLKLDKDLSILAKDYAVEQERLTKLNSIEYTMSK